MTRSYRAARPRSGGPLPPTLVAVALLCALVPGAVWADVPVPGTHGFVQEARVRLGPFADYTTRVHVVAEGETLSAIALRECGSADRVADVVALNPGLEADQVAVGAEILLPPRKTPRAPDADADAGEGPPPWWDFFTFTSPGAEFARLRADGEIPTWRYGTRLYAVRHEHVDGLLGRLREAEHGAWAVFVELDKEKPAWLAKARNDMLAYDGNVDEADPMVKRRTEYEVTDVRGGEVHMKVLSDKRFDASGKEIAAASGGAAGRWDLILSFFALVAAGGLFLLALARRRPAQRPAPQA